MPKYFNEGFFSSLVLGTSKQEQLQIPRELSELIGKNRFSIGDISEEDAIKLIRRRFNNPLFLPDNIIKQIFSHDKNPRQLLKNCEDICRSAADKGKEKAGELHDEQL